MKVTNLKLEGLKLIELEIFSDERGFFMERFHKTRFADAGLPTDFDQDNQSRSAPGVLRGLHYQTDPWQGKLVGVTRGRVWDVALDIRRESKTFGKWYGTELSDVNGKLLWIPQGFAHGFLVVGTEPADFFYKVQGRYNPKSESGIRWDDPAFKIEWPIDNLKSVVLSKKDSNLQDFVI